MSAPSSASGSCEAHVEEVGAPLHLGPADLRRLLEPLRPDEPRGSGGSRARSSARPRSPAASRRPPPARRSPRGRCGGADGPPGAFPSIARASARTCSAVVPQHPPTTLSQPSSAKRARIARQRLRALRVAPSASGRPAFGTHADPRRVIAASVRTWSVMNSGPVAQLSPRYRRSRCIRETASASTPCPASIVPVVSMVPETATGTRRPRRRTPRRSRGARPSRCACPGRSRGAGSRLPLPAGPRPARGSGRGAPRR